MNEVIEDDKSEHKMKKMELKKNGKSPLKPDHKKDSRTKDDS